MRGEGRRPVIRARARAAPSRTARHGSKRRVTGRGAYPGDEEELLRLHGERAGWARLRGGAKEDGGGGQRLVLLHATV
jgi:hypothetical protein